MKAQEKLREIIATRLTVARQNAGLSQAQAATLLKIPRPSISEIEAGRRKVSAEELVICASIYEVDIKWLSGQDADHADATRDKLQLAARNLSKLKTEDLEKVIELLTSVKRERNDG